MPQYLITEQQYEDLDALVNHTLEQEYEDFRGVMCEAGCLEQYPGLTEQEQEALQSGSRYSDRTVELLRKAALCPRNMHPYAVAYRTNEWICAHARALITGEPSYAEQYEARVKEEQDGKA